MSKAVAVVGGSAGAGFLAGTGVKVEDIAAASKWLVATITPAGAVSFAFNLLQGAVLAVLFMYFVRRDEEKRADAKEAFSSVIAFGKEIHDALHKHTEALTAFRVAFAAAGIVTALDRRTPAAGGPEGGGASGDRKG